MRIEVELRDDEVEIVRRIRQSTMVKSDADAIRFALHFLDIMLQYPPPSYFGEVIAKVLDRLGIIEYRPSLRLFPDPPNDPPEDIDVEMEEPRRRKMKSVVVVTFKAPRALIEQIDSLAKALRKSRSELIREAIINYIAAIKSGKIVKTKLGIGTIEIRNIE